MLREFGDRRRMGRHVGEVREFLGVRLMVVELPSLATFVPLGVAITRRAQRIAEERSLPFGASTPQSAASVGKRSTWDTGALATLPAWQRPGAEISSGTRALSSKRLIF